MMMIAELRSGALGSDVTGAIQPPNSARVNADPVHNLCVNGG
jgi:hypothetical protein